MVQLLWKVVSSIIVFYLCHQAIALWQALSKARRSGFPYLILPVFMQDIGWLFTQNLLLPVLDRLPIRWTERWLPLLVFHKTWNQSYEPFARVGADSFLAVSPGRTVLWTCDPESIDQILARREDFEKPLEAFQLLNIYGNTIAGSGGEQWRRLRKLLSPSFNEKTHKEVWKRSLEIADTMVASWFEGASNGYCDEIYQDSARLALHVLTAVCFDKLLLWNKERDGHGPVPSGHRTAYGESFAALLANLRTLYFSPPWALNSIPLPLLRNAKYAYDEWLQYMREMCDEKRSKMASENPEDSLGVLETLLTLSDKSQPGDSITEAELLGNIFVMILAGHETSGNTMAFAMLLMACRPDVQQALQKDLDGIAAAKPVTEWEYERDLPALLNGLTGAVIKETLRLFTPIPFLLRLRPDVPLPFTVEKQTYTLPESTTVFMNITAAHRNPRYWKESKIDADSRQSGTGEQRPYPIRNFHPQRWLEPDFLVQPGMFLPFSNGQRSCLGRRFSMIEMCAVVARVFSQYSVELMTGDEERVQELDRSTKNRAWEAARANAEREMSDGVKFVVTMKMTGKVGLRFVKRGEENYFDM